MSARVVHDGAPVLASLVSLFLQTLHHIRDLFGLKRVSVCVCVCVCYFCQPLQLLSVRNMPNIQIYVKWYELLLYTLDIHPACHVHIKPPTCALLTVLPQV